MAKLTLITGGAKSGKSEVAEDLYGKEHGVCYIATSVVRKNQDSEMTLKIKKHRQRRPADWTTEERYKDVSIFVLMTNYHKYLLDDATMMATNLFFDLVAKMFNDFPGNVDEDIEKMDQDQIESIQSTILQEFAKIADSLKRTDQEMMIVTNEVGLGLVPASKESRILRDTYGLVNQLLARQADEVYFVVSGLAQKIK
ncbi:adenosylcobinamide kinase [Lentilactobacillus fungorum]|uniref:Adenosylcobinamide kinase n=1 Tax=Lentilactobacillus fungorum TaxID=2201250 RepID=A0ABQ3VZC9_9LACO|nr:bifunctional adenosylcobinamide kinase/adenosylcobinamide-phosphate guanylyltransferase [Lentilactobacillus fungorum]GHP14275.1 adenosylcobinamide kinase [Lentilactobacillus fungorum]